MDLYTVTTIGKQDGKEHDRTPAVCTSLERAREILKKDEGGLDEAGYYALAVIERKAADRVYAVLDDRKRSQWWFRFENKKWKPCKRPKKYQGVTGFGVG